MARTTEQVLQHHRVALAGGDAAALMEDYAADAVLMTIEGAKVGTAAIAGFLAHIQKMLPNLKITSTGTSMNGELVLTAWKADSDAGTVPYGVDTIVIRDGKIRMQTVWFTIMPK
jgi:ketosteroid isomerase-like protein